ARKTAYAEHPISHNTAEGRRRTDAARGYNRVVEVGTQRRSGDVPAKAVRFLRDGGLGKVYAAKTVIYRLRDPIGVAGNSQVPPGVHYDLWLGPAPPPPLHGNPFHYPRHRFLEKAPGPPAHTAAHS